MHLIKKTFKSFSFSVLFGFSFMFLSESFASSELMESEIPYRPAERLNLRPKIKRDRSEETSALRDLITFPERVASPKITVQYYSGTIRNPYVYVFVDKSYSSTPDVAKHVFVVATYTIKMYDNDINFTKWNKNPLCLRLSSIRDKNYTAYTPITTEGITRYERKINYYGRSESDFEFDVIAHEVGHAVLDYIRPDFNKTMFSKDGNKKTKFQLSALHEAFADCTAFFSSLSMEASRGMFSSDISMFFNDPKYMQAIAPQWSRNPLGLRNPGIFRDYATYFKHGNYHDFSQLITGTVYRLISMVCNHEFERNLALVNSDFTSRLRTIFITSFYKTDISDDMVILDFAENLKNETIKVYPDLKTSVETCISDFKDLVGSLIKIDRSPPHSFSKK